MNERLLQYIWQFQYFNRNELCTVEGEEIQIIQQGKLNTNQGPDFTDARIRIGDTVFAGSVELHLKSSDWQRHGHSDDANYRNVILHVVYERDSEGKKGMPVLELQSRIPKIMLERYGSLMNSGSFIACANSISEVKEITWFAWKERLLAERLSRKTERILEMYRRTNGHWEETFWWLLARNFGSKINSDAFEQIARSLPVTILAKSKNSIHQLEALLLGQAGLLAGDFTEDYPQLLQREYRFLKAKYKLPSVAQPVHFLRMRPGNFPSLRLAQLAMLIHTSLHLFSKVLDAETLPEVKQWLNVTANDYWHYHYLLNEPSSFKIKKLGASMIDNIIINTLAPVLFAYGLYHNEEKYKTKALTWLEKTVAEKNSILNGFHLLSVSNKSAYDSQSLLELKNEYCNKKRCLECSVGNYLLKQ